jgi:hypothetical protein
MRLLLLPRPGLGSFTSTVALAAHLISDDAPHEPHAAVARTRRIAIQATTSATTTDRRLPNQHVAFAQAHNRKNVIHAIELRGGRKRF